MKNNTDLLNQYYKSLTRKLIFIILFVSFTPMIIIYFFTLNNFHSSYNEKVDEHLKELVQKHKQNIDSFLDEKLSNIMFLAGTNHFEKLSNEIFLSEQLESLQQKYKNAFVDIGVINSRGFQVAYAGPFKLKDVQYDKSDWFEKAISTDYYISDVFLGLRGLPHFIVTSRQKVNGDLWILRATIDFVKFNSLVENLRIGSTGFAFILNKEKEFQTKPLIDINPLSDQYQNLFKSSGKSSEITVSIMDDEDGQKIIYVSSFLKNGDWILIYQQNESDALSELISTERTAMIIFLFCLLAIIPLAIILSKYVVNLIQKADQEKNLLNRQVIETGKLASIGELAAGIAHEINNPIAIMVEEAGWMQDLLEEEELKKSENLEEFNKSLNQIRTQGRRCKEITHKLLHFARKTDSRVSAIQINELIEEMIELSTQRAKYTNVNISTNLKNNLPLLKLSQSELQQVLLNLINNALDAMEKKGGTLEIKTYKENNDIVVTIKDNGPGIPEANLTRIFDPFFTTKPVGKGTGLGLSICYGIVKKLGGDIEVKSIVGYGTTFYVKIPIGENTVKNI